MKFYKIFILALAISGCVFAGEIKQEQMYSPHLKRDWKYTVFLPTGYDSVNLPYPVIYLLHGNGDDENAWNGAYKILDSLINCRIVPPVIAVTPSGKRGWWVDSDEAFESAVIKDLIPQIDSCFRTKDSRNDRMIAGYSMGGYGALRYGLAWSDLFCACAIFSPALYNEEPPGGSSARTTGAFGKPFDIERWRQLNYTAALETYMKKGQEVFFFIGAGDDDWNNEEGMKYNVEMQTVLLYQKLHKELKIPAELRIIDGGHSWDVWNPLFIESVKLMTRSLQ